MWFVLLDGPRRVALSLQIELVTAGGGSKELEKRFRLPGELAGSIVFLGGNDHDGLTALLHHSLWPLGPYAPEQFAEARLRFV